MFLTDQGRPWVKTVRNTIMDRLQSSFARLLENVGAKQRGIGDRTLRRTFETVAEGTLDVPCVAQLMGRHDKAMTSTYRQRITGDRLRRVTEHVRAWLFGEKECRNFSNVDSSLRENPASGAVA